MELKPGYKRSEVGVIPSDWMVKPISQVAPLQRGFDLPTREIRPGPFPVVYSNGVENFHSVAMVKGPGVVTGRSGTLGKVHYIDTDYWPHNTSLWVTRFNDNIPKFIYYLYESLSFGRFASGSGVPTLNRNDAHSCRIALPSDRNEQRAIATTLSNVDALLDGLDRLIAKKRDLKQAAMQQLLTGQVRLPGFSGEWETKQLGDLLAYERPDRYIVKSTEYSNHGDIPVLTANKAFILGYTTEAFGVCADLPAIVFDDFTTASKFATAPFKVKSSAIKLLRPRYNRTSLRFLFDRMQLIRFPVGDHRRYYISDYQNIRLPIPESDEQLAVVSVLSDMDAEIAALEARRNKTRDLKQAMMQELLTGKTRLVPAGAAHA